MSLKGVGVAMLGIDHQHGRFEVGLSLDEIRAFLAGAEPVEFAAQGRAEICGRVERTPVRHEYARQGKAAKGLQRRYVERMTGPR